MFTMVPESEGVEHEESGNEYQIQNGNSYNLNYENFNLNCTNLDGEHSVNDLPSTLLRVKLYEVDIQSVRLINNQSKWIDKGTGRCRVEESFIGESPKLIVKSEDDPNVFIANTYIKDNTDYACQNGTCSFGLFRFNNYLARWSKSGTCQGSKFPKSNRTSCYMVNM